VCEQVVYILVCMYMLGEPNILYICIVLYIML
jgi:hypothetical protein